MRIIVRGIGVTGGFGCGVAELGQALANGTSRLSSLALQTVEGPVEIPVFRAGTSRLEEFCAKQDLRRIDHYYRLGLLGGYLALADAGELAADRKRLGVIVASGFGATASTVAFLDSLLDYGDSCVSPTHFANSVHNAAAATISIMLKATGPNLTVSQFDLSVPSALLAARQWLAEGRVDRVLFGAVDELSPLLGYVACRSRGVPATSAMAPLRSNQETAIMGEGAAFLLLSRADGESDGYCAIEEVATGSLPAGALPLPAGAFLVLGADGRRETGVRYRALVPPAARIACYSPLYGSMPAGPAFDLAAAALILKGGNIFSSPAGAGSDLPGTLANGALPPGVRVACVTLDGDNGYGVVTLGRS